MCFTNLASSLINSRKSSDAELKSNISAKRMLSNVDKAASGDVPVFAAHSNGKDLHSGKIMADIMRTATTNMAESSEKMAKENAKEMFTFG